MASVMCLQLRMQEEDILEHTSVRFHLCTLWLTCRLLCNIGNAPQNTIEYTHAKILENPLVEKKTQKFLIVLLNLIEKTIEKFLPCFWFYVGHRHKCKK